MARMLIGQSPSIWYVKHVVGWQLLGPIVFVSRPEAVKALKKSEAQRPVNSIECKVVGYREWERMAIAKVMSD